MPRKNILNKLVLACFVSASHFADYGQAYIHAYLPDDSHVGATYASRL